MLNIATPLISNGILENLGENVARTCWYPSEDFLVFDLQMLPCAWTISNRYDTIDAQAAERYWSELSESWITAKRMSTKTYPGLLPANILPILLFYFQSEELLVTACRCRTWTVSSRANCGLESRTFLSAKVWGSSQLKFFCGSLGWVAIFLYACRLHLMY